MIAESCKQSPRSTETICQATSTATCACTSLAEAPRWGVASTRASASSCCSTGS